MTGFPSFLRLTNTPFCIYAVFWLFIHLLVEIWSFPLAAIVNSAAMNMGVQVSLGYPAFHSLGYMPTLGSYGIPSFYCLRHCHTVFHSGCTSLQSYQQCNRVPIPPDPHTCYLFYSSHANQTHIVL